MARTLRFDAQLPVVAMEFEDVAGRSLCCALKVAGRSHGEANDSFRVLEIRSVLSGRLCIIRAVSFYGGWRLRGFHAAAVSVGHFEWCAGAFALCRAALASKRSLAGCSARIAHPAALHLPGFGSGA